MISIEIKRRAAELACVEVYDRKPTKDFNGMEVLYHFENGVNYLVFRGSDERKDWFKNFCFWPTKVDGLGKFHRAYWKEIDKHAPDIYNLIPNANIGNPIVLCGHSRGAALAQLFFVVAYFHITACLMFGSPKPVKRMYSPSIERLLRNRTTIYINPHDGITWLPLGWRYIGKEVKRRLRLVGVSEHKGANYLDLFDEFTSAT